MSFDLEKIKAGSNLFEEIEWPGTDEKLNMYVLNEQDILNAQNATDSVFSKYKIEFQNVNAYNSELETQRLYRALKNPDTGKLITDSISRFRLLLTPEIKNILADKLFTFMELSSPEPEKLSDEDFDILKEDLKKKPVEITGDLSSIFIARRLILSLVSQPAEPQSDS